MKGVSLPLGFTFSFPCQQNNLDEVTPTHLVACMSGTQGWLKSQSTLETLRTSINDHVAGQMETQEMGKVGAWSCRCF